ncbi:unannotated protein [freshwater metagenome]|uniref:Unannotated protein n=1 Tax=freshwater metagenome TaxID=449393 RepID=A0A6J7GWV4_9ZZZZ|nr:hypothetical protein [Actinomycetota bacterium]
MFRRVAVVLTCILVSSLFGIVTTTSATPVQRTYIAVIDAGSSGSRIGLFALTGVEGAVETLLFVKPPVPPLSTFESHSSDAGPDGIAPLIAVLDEKLAELGIDPSSVPVALFATAGMRRVEARNATAAKAIMASGRTAIATLGHPVRAARILPGELEAAYAWMDSNGESINSRTATHGVVEIGGASAQVSFETNSSKVPDVLRFTVDGRVFNVVSISYLGLGANDARMEMRRESARGVPCYPNNASGLRPKRYEGSSALPVRSVKANFDWEQCSVEYGRVIRRVGRSPSNSRENDRVTPHQVRDLASFGATHFQIADTIGYVLQDFGIARNKNESRRLKRAVTAVCAGSDAWAQVRAMYPADQFARAPLTCANATFVRSLIFSRDGFGIAPSHLDTNVQRETKWDRGFAWFELHGGSRA